MLVQPTREGFGKYDYLAPVPPNRKWGQITIQKFVNKYKLTNTQIYVNYMFTICR